MSYTMTTRSVIVFITSNCPSYVCIHSRSCNTKRATSTIQRIYQRLQAGASGAIYCFSGYLKVGTISCRNRHGTHNLVIEIVPKSLYKTHNLRDAILLKVGMISCRNHDATHNLCHSNCTKKSVQIITCLIIFYSTFGSNVSRKVVCTILYATSTRIQSSAPLTKYPDAHCGTIKTSLSPRNMQ